MNYQDIIMQIIISSGNAKSFAIEAINAAKKGNMGDARALLLKSDKELGSAHKVQTGLIQKEASGNTIELSLLMVHAQDHLMNAITVKDLASEIIDVYEKFCPIAASLID